MSYKRRIVILATVFIIFISLINIFIEEAWISQVQASSFLLNNKKQKVVIILADYIELQDLAKNEYLTWLFNNSYSSLISGRQNNKSSISKAKLYIGTGKKLEISNSLKNAANYNSDNVVPDNRIVVGEKGNVIYKDIKNLISLNRKNKTYSHIGYLGDKLKQYNKVTCLIGNSDTDIINRSAILIAMNKNGIVDVGDVENTLKYDSSFPGGKRTDFNKLGSLYNEYSTISDLMIIDTGDLARLDYYKNQLSLVDFTTRKAAVVDNIAEFTKTIIAYTKQKTTFIILSTYPSKRNLQVGFKLTPIIVYDNNGAGLLYSNSTKRTGIITNLDIADFILEKLIDAEKSSLKEVSESAPLWSMLSLSRRLLNISAMRLPVLTWYAIFEIICATAGLIYLFNSKNKNLRLNKFVKITVLVNIVAPVVLLYMSVLDISNPFVYFLLFILTSYIIATVIFLSIKTSINQFLSIALFVNISIIIDLMSGSNFIKNSVFGYDPIIGARFYGIGNEFAGVFIGSGILLAGCLLQHFKSFTERKSKTITLLLVIYSCFQLYIMGMPFIGSNFGGTIAAVFGYFFFFTSVKKRKVKLVQLLLLALVLIIALSSIVVLDLINPSNTTHVGKFITDIKENGITVLYTTLTRKAEMNIKLIKYTIWTKVLLCIIVIITIMFFKPVRLLHGIFKKYNYFTAAWIGIAAGSITGLLVNDSGIVMAATAMIFTGYTILYMCLEERASSN